MTISHAPRERVCFRCQKPGNLARDCRSKWPSPGRRNRCFRCDQPGHLAQDCNSAVASVQNDDAATVEARQQHVGLSGNRRDEKEPDQRLSGEKNVKALQWGMPP